MSFFNESQARLEITAEALDRAIDRLDSLAQRTASGAVWKDATEAADYLRTVQVFARGETRTVEGERDDHTAAQTGALFSGHGAEASRSLSIVPEPQSLRVGPPALRVIEGGAA